MLRVPVRPVQAAEVLVLREALPAPHAPQRQEGSDKALGPRDKELTTRFFPDPKCLTSFLHGPLQRARVLPLLGPYLSSEGDAQKLLGAMCLRSHAFVTQAGSDALALCRLGALLGLFSAGRFCGSPPGPGAARATAPPCPTRAGVL